jgi:ketosteroid isomerase-like protein
MASANVELVRSIYAAWERGDFSSADWADPDIEWVIADGPSPGHAKGLAELARGWGEFLGAWKDFRIEAEEYREPDDKRVVVLDRFVAHGRTSGLSLDETGPQRLNVFHIHDGRVTKLVRYLERETGLANLGLAPEGDSTAR